MHKRKANRVHRACHSCRKRKQGCDEQRPCKRCTEKGIECTEVEGKKKRRSDRGSDNEEDIYSDEEIVGTPEADGCDSCSEDEHSSIEAIDSDNNEVEEKKVYNFPRRRLITNSTSSLSSLLGLEMMPGTPTQDTDIEDVKPKHKPHLALLLPFLSSHMDNQRDGSSSGSDDEEDIELNMLSRSLRGEDFPFSGLSNEDVRLQEAMDVDYKDMWMEFLGHAKDDESLRREFQKIKGLWTEIMRCLRSLEWPKLHQYLAEIESDLSINDGPAVVFWSSGGRIQYANASFCRLVGFSSDELTYQNPSKDSLGEKISSMSDLRRPSAHSLFHPEDGVKISQRQLDSLEDVENQVGYYQTRARLVSKSRKEVPVTASITNVRDSYGMPLLTVAHFNPTLIY